MAVRKLSISDVRSLVGDEFRKGQTILDQGKLSHLVRTDIKLYAEAAGSRGSSYRTSITFDDQTTDGGTVTTASVTLSEGGFVAVHDGRLGNFDGESAALIVAVRRRASQRKQRRARSEP